LQSPLAVAAETVCTARGPVVVAVAQAVAGYTWCSQVMSSSLTCAGRSSCTQCPQPAMRWLLTSPGMVVENESMTFWMNAADASRAPPMRRDGCVMTAPSYAARSSQSRSTFRLRRCSARTSRRSSPDATLVTGTTIQAPGASALARGLGATLGRPVPRQRQQLLPREHRNGHSERGAERQR